MGTASCDEPASANSVHGANLAVAGGIHIQTVAKPSRRVAYGAIGLHTTVSPKGGCMPAVAVMRAFILFDFIQAGRTAAGSRADGSRQPGGRQPATGRSACGRAAAGRVDCLS